MKWRVRKTLGFDLWPLHTCVQCAPECVHEFIPPKNTGMCTQYTQRNKICFSSPHRNIIALMKMSSPRKSQNEALPAVPQLGRNVWWHFPCDKLSTGYRELDSKKQEGGHGLCCLCPFLLFVFYQKNVRSTAVKIPTNATFLCVWRCITHFSLQK